MNITLSIDEQTVEEARRVAQAMHKSLNQVIREYLEQFEMCPDPVQTPFSLTNQLALVGIMVAERCLILTLLPERAYVPKPLGLGVAFCRILPRPPSATANLHRCFNASQFDHVGSLASQDISLLPGSRHR